MRLAVLSDIHGNLHALETVLADLKATGGADQTWILGDLAVFCPEPVACIRAIRSLPEAKVIQGNTDRYLVTGRRPAMSPLTINTWPHWAAQTHERDLNFNWTLEQLGWEEAQYLLNLEIDLALNVEGYGKVVGFHGAPGDDERVLLPNTSDAEILDALRNREGRLAIGGHTHRPMDRSLASWRIVNPGSVGFPFEDDKRASYALLTFAGDQVQVDFRRVEYDLGAVLAALKEAQHPAIDWASRFFTEH
jgi:predicted phosphodiesterase